MIHGVREYLGHMLLYGKGDLSYTELEKKFEIHTYAHAGNRAKKMWNNFRRLGVTIDEYIVLISNTTRMGSTVAQNEPNKTLSNLTELKTTGIPDTREFTVTNNGATFVGKTSKSIRTLDEALEYSKVDLTLWEVSTYRFNSWDVTMKIEEIQTIDGKETKVFVPITITNYGCEVKFTPKSIESDMLYTKLIDEVLTCIPKFDIVAPAIHNNSRIGVLNIADLHIGAEVSNLIKTPDYNIEILIAHLNKIVQTINSHNYKEVHVNMVGDYFESISGLNHLNTFKSLGRGMYGSKVIILASTIIGDMLRKINNLVSVNLISGNHDRLTPQSDIDNEGGAAELLCHILSTQFDRVKFRYHTYLLNPVIDNICYIMSHGNFKLDKKDIGKIVSLYGDNNLYNLWVSGHIHTRQTEKTTIRRTLEFDTYIAVSSDEAPYRKIILPPVFTGNFYSETLGYTSSGGCVITENNGNGKPNVYDYTL